MKYQVGDLFVRKYESASSVICIIEVLEGFYNIEQFYDNGKGEKGIFKFKDMESSFKYLISSQQYIHYPVKV